VFTEAFSSLFSLQSKEQCPKLGKIEGRMLAAYVVSPSGHAWIVLFLCDKGFQSERASRPCGGSLRRTPAAIEPMRSDPKAPSSSSSGPLACVYPECLLLLAPLDTVWDAGNSRFSRLQRAGGTVPVQTRYQRVTPRYCPPRDLLSDPQPALWAPSIIIHSLNCSIIVIVNTLFDQHTLGFVPPRNFPKPRKQASTGGYQT
jgi:hypothetical protein